ncbi:tyrosinase family protein [Sphingomonas sp. QA11]|uniref:tyrosinase family protein n=1 Tax=Sphingomonas sp. QA11 TaxID=2950605 RepID=UPI00234988DD|nr:tyrosinase family protein [Sphingomonas sp. QA11]WCM27514.1 tyrosinase family protein [Sphingomonas sp. QA11]
MSYMVKARLTALHGSAATLLIIGGFVQPASAQSGDLQASGPLVRQDSSDCGNNNVNGSDPARNGGLVTITQNDAGDTSAVVQISKGTPNTSYDFYWKCQRGLGQVRTDASGAGNGTFGFKASAGATLTFDMYPAGAPPGNKFQSVRLTPGRVATQRKSILQLNATELASLRRGVAQMKAWSSEPRGSANYRRSWIYWANMHAYFGTGCANPSGLNAAGMSGLTAQAKSNADENATWCTCQHGTVQFLTWHRMYLYYFEKVLQAASGDANLRLPYWDYESNAQMPAAYRDQTYVNANGQTVPNPLYIPNRQAQLNAGTSNLAPSVVSTANAMQQTSYNPFNSALESTPHGAVHCAVGVANCPTGYMGAVPAAGNDPIFYTHHTNIDRLYECWLKVNQAARLPNNQGQLNATFNFIDGTGALVTRTVKDMLTTAQLGYSYAGGGGCPATLKVRLPVSILQETPLRVYPLAGPTPLQRGTTVLPLKIAPDARKAMLQAAPEKGGETPRSVVVIDGFTFDEAPGVLYEVYVQGAGGKRVLLGVINFFNLTAPHGDHGDMPGMGDMAGASDEKTFDATDALKTLGGNTSLVIEPSTGVTGTTPALAARQISPRANVRFSSARIELR